VPDLRPFRLQLFGERCSGTNYVEQLLRRNEWRLQPTDAYGWKHGWLDAVRGPAPECLFLVVHRDPFDWVRSLHQKPWHTAPQLRELPLSAFLRAPWHCEWGQDMDLGPGDPRRGTEMLHERDQATGERFANVLQLRTAKMRAWSELPQRVRHASFLRYEDAAADPRSCVRTVAAAFGLRTWPWLRAVKTFKGGKDPFQAKRYPELSADDVQWIASQLDHELERRHGYLVAARAKALLAGRGAAVSPR